MFHSLLEIVTYLPTGDILEFACCSQALHEVARSPSTWQRLYYRHAGWQFRRPIRPDLRVQTEIDEPSTDTLDWRMLCRERQELEERWTKTRFTPRKLAVKPAKSAVYCSFALENYIITGSRNRSICFYEYDQDKRSLLVIFKIKEAHAGSVLCMVVDPAGAGGAGTMYTGGSDGKVNVWDLAEFLTEWDTFKGTPKLVGSLKGHCGGVLDLVIDNCRVLTWCVSCMDHGCRFQTKHLPAGNPQLEGWHSSRFVAPSNSYSIVSHTLYISLVQRKVELPCPSRPPRRSYQLHLVAYRNGHSGRRWMSWEDYVLQFGRDETFTEVPMSVQRDSRLCRILRASDAEQASDHDGLTLSPSLLPGGPLGLGRYSSAGRANEDRQDHV